MGNLINIVIGYIIWRYIPGKITVASKNVRKNIDVSAQILGIILMLTGVVGFIKFLII